MNMYNIRIKVIGVVAALASMCVLSGCVLFIHLRVRNHFPFPVQVIQPIPLLNKKVEVQILGSVPAGGTGLFRFHRIGSPRVFDVQFLNGNGKVVEEVREEAKRVLSHLSHRTWEVTVGPSTRSDCGRMGKDY